MFSLYHGTKRQVSTVSEYPKAMPSVNGHGFYLTDKLDIAMQYGSVIEYVLPMNYKASLVRQLSVNGVDGLEFVLTQSEADALVLDHALSIIIH